MHFIWSFTLTYEVNTVVTEKAPANSLPRRRDVFGGGAVIQRSSLIWLVLKSRNKN